MEDIKNIHNQELSMLIEVDEIAKSNNIKYYLAYGTTLGAVRHKGFIPWDTDVDIMVGIDEYDTFCELLNKNLSDKYTFRHIKYDQDFNQLLPRVTLKNDIGLVIHVDIFPMVGAPLKDWRKKIFSKVAYLNHRLFFMKNIQPNVNYKNKRLKRIMSKIIKVIIFPIPRTFFIKLDDFLVNLFPMNKAKELYNIYGSYGMREYIPKKWLNEVYYEQFEGHKLPIPIKYDKYLENFYGDYMTPKKENYLN